MRLLGVNAHKVTVALPGLVAGVVADFVPGRDPNMALANGSVASAVAE